MSYPIQPAIEVKKDPVVYQYDQASGRMVRVDKIFQQAGIAAEQTSNEQLLRVVAALAATGSDVDTICKTLGLKPDQVRQILSDKRAAATISRIQSVFFPEPGARVKKLGNLAVDTILQLMLTAEKDETRLKAAQDLADRALGKAVQVTENRNINFNVDEVNNLDQSIETLQKKIDDTQRMLAMKRQSKELPAS